MDADTEINLFTRLFSGTLPDGLDAFRLQGVSFHGLGQQLFFVSTATLLGLSDCIRDREGPSINKQWTKS